MVVRQVCDRYDNEPIRRNGLSKVSKGAELRNRYNPVPHLTQDTNGKVTSLIRLAECPGN